MKIDFGLLVTFLLLGAISSVIPILGPFLVGYFGSHVLLKRKSFAPAFFSYLAFMIGTGLAMWFLWPYAVQEFPVFSLLILSFLPSMGFLLGYLGPPSRSPV